MRKIAIALVLAALSGVARGQSVPESASDQQIFESLIQTPEAWIESRVETVSADSIRAPEGGCVANATTLCLNNGRFQVTVIFSAPTLGINNAPAQAVLLTSDTGYFWFFSANNVEITMKAVDGRAFNGFFWFFYAAMSDVSYTITVTDTVTNAVKTYSNAAGTLASVADTAAFPGGPTCTFTVGAANPASFGSGGGSGTVGVTTASGCAWTATSGSSFVTITNPGPGSGNGTVSFSVAANPTTSSRNGTMTIAGQTVTISQAGMSGGGGGGQYDGTWSGTTSQTCQPSSGARPCQVGWTIANGAFTQFRFEASSSTCGVVHSSTTINYTTPLPISGNSFSVSTSGSPPVRVSFNVSGTFNSSSSASGSAAVTFTLTPPAGNCSNSIFTTYGASKN